MNATWHILQKDLRRFGPVIALAIAINLFGYCVSLSNLDAIRGIAGLTKFFHAAPLAGWVAAFLTAAWVILEDTAVGDRAAWLTRPIRAREILAAKFCFLIVAAALPAGLVAAGVAGWLEASAAQILAAGTSSLLVTFLGAAVFAMAAVVSTSMHRAILLLAAVFAVVALGSYLIFDFFHLALPLYPAGVSGGTKFMVLVASVSLTTAATLGHQYATRRTGRTVFLSLGMALLGWLTCHYWPLDFWPKSAPDASAAATPVAGLQLVPTGAQADFRTTQHAFGGDIADVLIPLNLRGLPPDRAFMVNSVTVTLTSTALATPLSSHSDYGRGTVFADKLSILGFFLGFKPVLDPQAQYVPCLTMPLDRFKSLQGRIGHLTGEVHLTEGHYAVIARLPVRAGATARDHGRLSRIQSLEFVNGHFEIGFQFAEINPALASLPNNWPNFFMLVNEGRKEYAEFQAGSTFGTGGPAMSLITTRNTFGTTRSARTGDPAGKVDAAWVDGAEFWFLKGDNVAGSHVVLPLDVPQLTLPEKQVTSHVIIVRPDGTRTEFDR